MSTTIWPALPPDELAKREEQSLVNEIQWLLSSLQETFASLKAGLEECAALLSPDKGPSTLALSSQRSESLKGYVTRVGTRVVKGDMHLRIPTLGPPPKGSIAHRLTISNSPTAPTLVLHQITAVRTLINTSLDIIDVSRWTGDAMNAQFIAGQLRLLCENMSEARSALKGSVTGDDEQRERRQWEKEWWEEDVDSAVFDPSLPANLSFHLSVVDAALVLHVRTLAPAETHDPHSLREKFASALGAHRPHPHDEQNTPYTYKGSKVIVREKLKVESQDPALLAAMAKLSALEHGARMSRRALGTLMGVEE